MSMKLIARSRAPFFKLCGKRALLSLLCAPREFQGNSPAKGQAAARVDAFRSFLYDESVGRLAQLVRAPALQAGGRRFEPCTAHDPCAPPFRGDVVQLVRTLPCRCLESHTVVQQLLFQHSPRLNEQATVNGFVGHSLALVIGILGLQPSGNLFGRPVQHQFTRNDVPQLAVHGKKTPFPSHN